MLLTMKRNVIFVLAACLALTICIFALAANAQQSDKKAKRVTVTGCLQKGDQAEEFFITGENGRNYELVSSTVKLAEHVGHKVSVTGTVIEDEDEESENPGQGEGGSGRLQVTSLKMISEACK